MNYLELNEKYFVLSPIIFENDIVFVCRNKSSFLYEFFCKQDGDFKLVDSNKTEKLKKIYHESVNDYVSFYVDHNIQKESRKRLIESHKFCKKLICDKIKNFPKNLQNKILGNIDTVLYTNKPIKNKLIFALYSLNNSINIGFELGKSNGEISQILHELLHCASASKYKNSTGFLTSEVLSKSNNLDFRINEFINEAYTEILREELLVDYPQFNYDKKIVPLYSPIQIMLKSLLNFANKEKLDLAYFETNGNDMLKILQQEFHTNENQILRLSLLFDSTSDSIMAEYNSRIFNNSKYHLISLGKLICDLVLNKYVQENKDIKQLKFEEIFKYIQNATIVEKIYNECLSNLKNYFELSKNNLLTNEKTNILQNDNFKYYVKMFLESVIKNTKLPLDFPEELKTAEMFSLVLTKKAMKNGKLVDFNSLNNIISIIFDENNNYLPHDIKSQSNILNMITNSNIPLEECLKYYPKNNLAQILNKNILLFENICKKDIMSVYNVLDGLENYRKTTRVFYQNLIKAVADKTSKLELLKNYITSLTPAQQKSLLCDGNFIFITKKHANLNPQELLDFKNFTNSITQSQQDFYR